MQPASDKQQTEQAAILLVDDDEAFCYLLHDLLLQDYEVLVAASVLQAVALLDIHPLDLILLDLNLPILHSVDMIETLHEACGNIPILAISDYPQLETLLDRHAVEAVLPKPFHQAELHSTITETLQKHGQAAPVSSAD